MRSPPRCKRIKAQDKGWSSETRTCTLRTSNRSYTIAVLAVGKEQMELGPQPQAYQRLQVHQFAPSAASKEMDRRVGKSSQYKLQPQHSCHHCSGGAVQVPGGRAGACRSASHGIRTTLLPNTKSLTGSAVTVLLLLLWLVLLILVLLSLLWRLLWCCCCCCSCSSFGCFCCCCCCCSSGCRGNRHHRCRCCRCCCGLPLLSLLLWLWLCCGWDCCRALFRIFVDVWLLSFAVKATSVAQPKWVASSCISF